MDTQKKKTIGIRRKLFSMILFPIVSLSVMIILFGMLFLYHSYTRNIRDELASTTNILIDCLDWTVRGDYSYEKDMLIKGDLNITDSTMLYRIKEKSDIDTTIFWQDTRVLTTVEGQYGVSAVGTKAGPQVIRAVLEQGQDYYSDDLNINGVAYIGYYRPLQNSDQAIVGMVFAGKNKEQVYRNIFFILVWFVLLSLIAILLASSLTRVFSARMVSDIDVINGFLKTISEGDLTAALDERIEGRNDELGTIGQYATKMRNDLKKMIEMDPLTNLYNRRSCNNKLNVLEREQAEYSVVMCDIDWFKKINDNYGHDAGDYILVMVSKMIQDNIKDSGFASRWGGEEFLLVYEMDFEQTRKRVEQLQKDIREFDFQYGDVHIGITLTFGLEEYNRTGSYEERIKSADNKLYIGKNNGRDQIVC